MARLKPLLFIVALSVVSAVTLRLLLGRISAGMRPQPAAPIAVDSAAVDRRMVGCGHFHFVFDSLGYRSGQWPDEVDGGLAAGRSDALFRAHDGQVEALREGEAPQPVGDYRIVRDTAYLTLGPVPGGLRARLGVVGDSLGGQMERAEAGGGGAVVGRLFLSTPVPPPPACSAG